LDAPKRRGRPPGTKKIPHHATKQQRVGNRFGSNKENKESNGSAITHESALKAAIVAKTAEDAKRPQALRRSARGT